jgi:hypothetical protein
MISLRHLALFPTLVILPLAAEETKPEPAPVLDFGDFSSQVLTSKAWDALGTSNHTAVDAYVAKCIELYTDKAKEMQASLTEAAGTEKAKEYWALNDVGTCHFIRAQSKEARGDTKAALEDYKAVTEKYSFAQCWDTKGWYWKPAEAAKAKVKSLEFDALK